MSAKMEYLKGGRKIENKRKSCKLVKKGKVTNNFYVKITDIVKEKLIYICPTLYYLSSRDSDLPTRQPSVSVILHYSSGFFYFILHFC